MKIVILGNPATKKNSPEIVFVNKKSKGGKGSKNGKVPILLPSKAYRAYEKLAKPQLMGIINEPIDIRVNLKAVYYMRTHHVVDLNNLLEGTCDLLVAAKVLKDDNTRIVATHDGSEVLYDSLNPRVEIEITAK